MGRTISINIYDDKQKTPGDFLLQRRVYKKDDMREYRYLCKQLDKLLYVRKGDGNRLRYHGLRSTASARQLCMVKMRIGKTAAAHRRFLREYLPQENKAGVIEKPRLFSTAGMEGDCAARYAETMAETHFKCIISPENPRVDLPALVKTLVKRMEQCTGFHFSWIAATHTDTNHPHAHLLINGTDRDKRPVRFDKVFITQTMREICRQICTELIGKRSREEIRASLLRSYQWNRYCAFDDALQELERPLAVPQESWQSEIYTDNDLLVKRLCHLADLRLARRKAGTAHGFLLEKNWVHTLRTIGRYNSFLTVRSSIVSDRSDEVALYTAETGEISGTITRLYTMNDEDAWNHAIVIENAGQRKAWYVPLYFKPDSKLVGTEITCAMRTNQKGLLVPRLTVKNWNGQKPYKLHQTHIQ
jgi:hypothetical protein